MSPPTKLVKSKNRVVVSRPLDPPAHKSDADRIPERARTERREPLTNAPWAEPLLTLPGRMETPGNRVSSSNLEFVRAEAQCGGFFIHSSARLNEMRLTRHSRRPSFIFP